jgi:hypothetical protein
MNSCFAPSGCLTAGAVPPALATDGLLTVPLTHCLLTVRNGMSAAVGPEKAAVGPGKAAAPCQFALAQHPSRPELWHSLASGELMLCSAVQSRRRSGHVLKQHA